MQAKSSMRSVIIVALGLLLLCGSGSALVPTKEVPLNTYLDLAYKSCATQGFDYFDSLTAGCKNCDATLGMVVDASSVDGRGDATQCKCAPGYFKTSVNCFDSLGLATCKSFTCTLCSAADPVVGPAAYHDRSGCAACDADTSDMGVAPAELECICKTKGHVLVETDDVGNKLATTSKTGPPASHVLRPI